MAIGAVLLSFLASIFCACYVYAYAGAGAGTVLAVYAVTGTAGLMTFTLVNGFRWSDFR